MDGTIYKGGTLFDFTPAFFARLDALGVGYTLLTNNSSKSIPDYLAHLRRMGIEASADQLYTSGLATIDYLKSAFPSARRVFVLGTPSLREEFRRAGFDVMAGDETSDSHCDSTGGGVSEPEIVVVGFDTALDYPRLCKAAYWIEAGKPFIATHPDRICPTDRATVLVDCGAVCACLESATGRAPDTVLGKPDPRMLDGILKRHGLRADQLAMAGDRIYTDVAMGRRTGALAVLVLTGEATREDAARSTEPPDLIVKSLKEFGELLSQAKE